MAAFVPSDYAGRADAQLPAPVSCNIIHIANVAESIEKNLEEWKYCQNPNTARFERMEHVNRPVIYGVDLDLQEKEHKPSGTYKLLLRDSHDNYFYAVELEEMPFLHPREKTTSNPLPIPLGGSLVLQKGTTVCEGIVLLRKHQCNYLGADPDSELLKQLNSGIVEKYIEMMERQRENNAS